MSFAQAFPEQCSETNVPCGTDVAHFANRLKGDVPTVEYSNWSATPSTGSVLDTIEFCFKYASRIVRRDEPPRFHNSQHHHFMVFDVMAGKAWFQQEVNSIFHRNGLVWHLADNGRITRLLPPVLREVTMTEFDTGDTTLDDLLGAAYLKFIDPKESVRRESLEKLWDAWERLKTLTDPNPKNGVNTMLNYAAPRDRQPKYRTLIEEDATHYAAAGNKLGIRHANTSQEEIRTLMQVDYLFHRLYALIRLVLESRPKS